MTLIEGVGDEVVHFVGFVFVTLVAALAWWSTNANPDRYRTVLVMRSRSHHPVTVSIRTNPHRFVDYMLLPSMNEPLISGSDLMISSSDNSQAPPSITAGGETAGGVQEVGDDSSQPVPLQEMDSIVDADVAMLEDHRLHFYRRVDNSNSSAEPPSAEPLNDEEFARESNEQIREMESIVSAMEAEVAASCALYPNGSSGGTIATAPPTVGNVNVANKSKRKNLASNRNPSAPKNDASDPGVAGQGGGNAAGGDERRILIKLKYLNDTLKEVEGSLDEMLKDFKWRHFSSELTAESRVRLIFNGRPLADDRATLGACGLHHRAVVHCLVHPKPNRNLQSGGGEGSAASAAAGGAPPSGGAARPELVSEGLMPERAWDLENVLMTLVSVALTVVWFFRCEYSSMFTASASVALFGLTVFYSVAIFGLYLSDSFHERRQPPTPAARPPDDLHYD